MEPSSAGMLMSGTTCPDEGSALLQAAGHAGMVTGQVIIMTDFTDLYGGVFVTDLAGLASAATVRIRDHGIPEFGKIPAGEGPCGSSPVIFGAVLWDEKHR